jgi:hypothetical protein
MVYITKCSVCLSLVYRYLRWMSRACRTYGEKRGVCRDLGGETMRKRDNLGDPDVVGRIILRWIFRKCDVGVWIGSSWFRIGTGGGHL